MIEGKQGTMYISYHNDVTHQCSVTTPFGWVGCFDRNRANFPIPHQEVAFYPNQVNKMIFPLDNTYNIKSTVRNSADINWANINAFSTNKNAKSETLK
jgi:hypothetical protein